MKLLTNIAKTTVAVVATVCLTACEWNDTFEGIVADSQIDKASTESHAASKLAQCLTLCASNHNL